MLAVVMRTLCPYNPPFLCSSRAAAMAERVDRHTLKNGMVILGEPMEAVQSVAFCFMLPCGAALLPAGCCGAANVIEDWVFRGAGARDSRQLSDALDGLGLHRSSGVGTSHLTFGAALESGNLAAALDLYGDIILRPHLDAEQFILSRQLAIDAVKGLDDDPRQKVMLKVHEQFYPPPLGRSTAGEIDQLSALAAEKAGKIAGRYFNISRTTFAVAGRYDFDSVCARLEKLFAAAPKGKSQSLRVGPHTPRYKHIPNEGAQVHIGLMTPTAKPGDKDYYNARLACSVLSGGMSARLFTEVREKRGLCYAVGASYHALKQAAGIACYAGTTPDKAQQTLDVVLGEFKRLADGISDDEIARAKVGLKSNLIMQSESSSSRAAGIASDYYLLGRVRTLDEIKEHIEMTSVDSVLGFLRANPPRRADFTVVTIGPREVKV